MAAPLIQVKRGLFADLPALKAGEPGFTTDKYDLFVGVDETINNNQFFGSGRYWEREDATNAAQLKLVDKDGSNSISLQVPNTTTGIGTWIFPDNGTGADNEVLAISTATGNEYTLEWKTISEVGQISTATRATAVDVTDTDSQSGNIVFAVAGLATTLYNDTDLSYNSNTNVLTGPTIEASTQIQTPAVKASDGTDAITIADSSGNVSFVADVTVAGDLTINGTTTQINTNEIEVYDRTITLGIQTGATPTTTTWDLGILMNYGDAGTAKTSGVIWDSSEDRFQFGQNVGNPASGNNTSTPIFNLNTASQFAPIEVAALYLSDTAGIASAVASYLSADGLFTGSAAGRYLQNINVDAGTF